MTEHSDQIPDGVASQSRALELAREIRQKSEEMSTLFEEAASLGLKVDFFGDNVEREGKLPYTVLRAEVWSPL